MTTIIVHLHSPCFPRKPSGDIPCRLLFGKSISWSGANASKHFSNPTSLHSHKLPSYFGYGIRESCTQRARCWQSTTVCMMAGSNSILPALVRKGLKLTLQMQVSAIYIYRLNICYIVATRHSVHSDRCSDRWFGSTIT